MAMAKWTHAMSKEQKLAERTDRAAQRIRQRRDAGKSIEAVADYARHIAMMWRLPLGELGLTDAELLEVDRLNTEAAARQARADEATLERAAEEIRTGIEMEMERAEMVRSLVHFADGLEQAYPRQDIVDALLEAAFELCFEDEYEPPDVRGLCHFARALGAAGAALIKQDTMARDIIVDALDE
jgi:hypothetical protein